MSESSKPSPANREEEFVAVDDANDSDAPKGEVGEAVERGPKDK